MEKNILIAIFIVGMGCIIYNQKPAPNTNRLFDSSGNSICMCKFVSFEPRPKDTKDIEDIPRP